MHQHIRGFDETPIMATFLGPPCAIATSTATIRMSVDHPTIANVSGTAREKSRRTIFDFFQTRKRFCGSRKAKAFPFGRAMSVVVGNSEVSALRSSSQFGPKSDMLMAPVTGRLDQCR